MANSRLSGTGRSKPKVPVARDSRTKAALLYAIENLERQIQSEKRIQQDLRSDLSFEKEQYAKAVSGGAKRNVELNDKLNDRTRELNLLRKKLRALEKEADKPPFEKMVVEQVEKMPENLRKPLKEIALDPSMNDVIKMVMERERDFPTPERALLAGVAMDLKSRRYLDDQLEAIFDATSKTGFRDARRSQQNQSIFAREEVVIGGGIHAAIYCAVRVALGFPPPRVFTADREGTALLSRARVGGVFATTRNPAFFLNSRNRPGDLSVPGMDGALNVLPAAPLQPSEISAEEYQTNDTLGFIARLTLAMCAKVTKGTLTRLDGTNRLRFVEGTITPRRVIIATGLTNQRRVTPNSLTMKRVLTFEQFIGLMDQPFPFRGFKKVAVIGAGDSGKTAVEALCGQGPSMMSSAMLDWPEKIDWYGVPGDRQTKATWETCVRSRYKGIGRLLPDGVRAPRVQPKERLARLTGGFERVYVNGTPYDYVIDCTGYTNEFPFDTQVAISNYVADGEVIAKQANPYQTFVIGPAANIEPTETEALILKGISENKTSIFLYARRTALLAERLSV